MEDKSELIKTFLMSVEFYGRDDIEIIVSKMRVDFYCITIYTHLGPNDGVYSRIIKTIDIVHIINLIDKYGICDKHYLKVERGWKEYYTPYERNY